MEQISQQPKRYVWWVAGLMVGVAAVGWVILAASFSANWSMAIAARNAMFHQ